MATRPLPAISVAPDVWRVTGPLPWRPRLVHAYLVRLGSDGWMLVDGGADTDAAWETLDAGVREVAGGWKAIALHVVTHMHVDHIGLAARVRDASGARLAMHRLDAERVAGAAADPAGGGGVPRKTYCARAEHRRSCGAGRNPGRIPSAPPPISRSTVRREC